MENKFTLFVGLNDKDTKVQKYTTTEAYKIVENICYNVCGGATISEALGIYTHDDGAKIRENSLRVEILYSTKEKVLEVINLVKVALNQESVMMTEEVINVMYY